MDIKTFLRLNCVAEDLDEFNSSKLSQDSLIENTISTSNSLVLTNANKKIQHVLTQGRGTLDQYLKFDREVPQKSKHCFWRMSLNRGLIKNPGWELNYFEILTCLEIFNKNFSRFREFSLKGDPKSRHIPYGLIWNIPLDSYSTMPIP